MDITGGPLKTACLITGTYTQADADSYCRSNNMVLFQIDSDNTQTQLFSFLETNLAGSNFVFRVDGLRDEVGDNNWYYYSYGKAPAFSGLQWILSSDTKQGLNSLIVTNMARQMF